ncbi:hypothetical protein [Xanthomonas sp. 4461]|uniref:hypothetical protein n=1 Tax=Xanthomonas sp. 4461 TaxID=3035313 RepID=UPI002168C3CD|nr:hypothetical protein [Xanthomonas sp. 4461]MCS3810854.1 hypothetical protein [Xanthomonas sp. 4461]
MSLLAAAAAISGIACCLDESGPTTGASMLADASRYVSSLTCSIQATDLPSATPVTAR